MRFYVATTEVLFINPDAQAMPYGNGRFFYSALNPGRGRGGERTLRPLDRRGDKTRGFNSEESLWAQYQVLRAEAEGRCHRAMSNFHAGPGQITTCQNFRRKVDLTLVTRPGRIVFMQYHGYRHVLEGAHLPGCLIGTESSGEQEEEEDEEEDDDESDLSADFSSDESDVCEASGSSRSGAILSDGEEDPKVSQLLTRETRRNNALLRSYCRHLNEAAEECGIDISFSCAFDYSCNFFHGSEIEKGETCLQRLLERRYGDDSVTGKFLPCMDERQLLREILLNREVFGFVTIEGGHETSEDHAALAQAFLVQKHKSGGRTEELGPYARRLVDCERDFAGDDSRITRELDREAKKRELTVVRRSVLAKTPLTMTVHNLRQLVQERGLRGFRILHFVQYASRYYHSDFIADMLQARWDLKLANSEPLQQLTLKILLNALFGFMLLESPKFKLSKVVTRETEYKRLKKDPSKLYDLRNLSVLGFASSADKPDLLLRVVRENDQSKIENLAQGAANILCQSKMLFFAHLLYFLRVLDPRKACVVYKDTDSIFVFTREEKFEDNVRPSMRAFYERTREDIFVDEQSAHTQAGKMKLEGVYKGGLFRTVKSYMLLDSEDRVEIKCKAIGNVAKRQLEARHFLPPTEGEEEDVISFWRLGGIPGESGELGMNVSGKKLPSRVNFKRNTLARTREKKFFF